MTNKGYTKYRSKAQALNIILQDAVLNAKYIVKGLRASPLHSCCIISYLHNFYLQGLNIEAQLPIDICRSHDLHGQPHKATTLSMSWGMFSSLEIQYRWFSRILLLNKITCKL